MKKKNKLWFIDPLKISNSLRDPQNPGLGGLDELTSAEEAVIQQIASLAPQKGAVLASNATGTWYTLGVGTNAQVLTADSAQTLGVKWDTPAGGGDVTAASNLTDNTIVRGDGGAKGVQTSTITITDDGNLTTAKNIDAGSITAGTYQGLTLTNAANGFTINGGTTPQKLTVITNFVGLNQSLRTTDSPALTDLTISSPSSIYSLSHNSFAGYVANEHIDWTNATKNFITTLNVNAGSITANTYQGLTLTNPANGFTISGGTTPQKLTVITNFVGLNQSLRTTDSPTLNDLTISTPSSIYSLSHNSFAGYVANEHINWINATSNFLTTLNVNAGSITVSGTYNSLTLSKQTTGFKIFGGTTSKDFVNDVHSTMSLVSKRIMYIKVISDTSSLTAGDGQAYLTIPSELNKWDLIAVASAVYSSSNVGLPIIDLYNVTDATGFLNTRITLDANEYNSYTAATAAVINTNYDDVATGDRIRCDVDGSGDGTKGLDVILTFREP